MKIIAKQVFSSTYIFSFKSAFFVIFASLFFTIWNCYFVFSFVGIQSSHLKFKVTFGKRLVFVPSFVWCQENNDFWCGSQFTKVTSIIHGKAMKPLYGAIEHWTLHPIQSFLCCKFSQDSRPMFKSVHILGKFFFVF